MTADHITKQYFFLEAILNNVSDPIFVKDREHRFIYVNDAACLLFGYDRIDVLGKTDFDIFPEKEAIVYRLKDIEVFKTGQENINVEKLTNSSGKQYTISTKKTIYQVSSSQSLLVAIIRDISDLKKTEEKLLDTADKLAEFAYEASHDIRAPLRTINSFLGLLEREIRGGFSEKARTYFNYIKAASITANNLVRDLLAHATTNDSNVELDLMDLNVIIADIELNIMTTMLENEVALNYNNLPIIYGSRFRLYQLFQNLILNSIKFRKEDEKPVITIKSTLEGSNYKITVTDNGIGIAAADFERIFDIFTKLNSPEKYIGSGIGLTTCQKIVESIGGRIAVASELGVGTTFAIYLPKKPEQSVVH